MSGSWIAAAPKTEDAIRRIRGPVTKLAASSCWQERLTLLQDRVQQRHKLAYLRDIAVALVALQKPALPPLNAAPVLRLLHARAHCRSAGARPQRIGAACSSARKDTVDLHTTGVKSIRDARHHTGHNTDVLLPECR
jgi:hypothetical protein